MRTSTKGRKPRTGGSQRFRRTQLVSVRLYLYLQVYSTVLSFQNRASRVASDPRNPSSYANARIDVSPNFQHNSTVLQFINQGKP